MVWINYFEIVAVTNYYLKILKYYIVGKFNNENNKKKSYQIKYTTKMFELLKKFINFTIKYFNKAKI